MLDDALVHITAVTLPKGIDGRLNPCYAGRCSSTNVKTEFNKAACLNPCYAGRCSSTRKIETILIINMLQNYAKVIFAFLNQKLTIP